MFGVLVESAPVIRLPHGGTHVARLSLDSEECQGHGRCYALAPGLFDCDDSGYAIVLVDHPVGDEIRAARQAVDACPERAIALDESADE